MLNLKLQYSSHLMQKTDSLEKYWYWERLKVRGEGDNRGWDGWKVSSIWWTWVWVSLGAGDGQGSLACCSPWGHKELDMTEVLNQTELQEDYVPCGIAQINALLAKWSSVSFPWSFYFYFFFFLVTLSAPLTSWINFLEIRCNLESTYSPLSSNKLHIDSAQNDRWAILFQEWVCFGNLFPQELLF